MGRDYVSPGMIGCLTSNKMMSQSKMLLITDLNDVPSLTKACGLTIGSFDGVHLGHQALLNHLKSKLPSDGVLCVFTFSTHPSHLFCPETPVPLICPPLQKVKHLADYGADLIFLIPFTPEFAKTSFESFLRQLKKRLHFSHLAFGIGAAFGKNREGDEINVRHLASELAFETDYLPKTMIGGAPVSSGRIRSLITQGSFQEVQTCLGRPYSLMGRLQQENGFYHFFLPGICHPPEGIYSIRLKTTSSTYLGRAHISTEEPIIRLELLKTEPSLHGKDAEVIF
jgi:riboflavin kinase / FMN adenylyltransferase